MTLVRLFSEAEMEQVKRFESYLDAFYARAKSTVRRRGTLSFPHLDVSLAASPLGIGSIYDCLLFQPGTESDKETRMRSCFSEAKKKVHSALCDSIGTRSVIECLRQLIKASNVYMDEVCQSFLVSFRWITSIICSFSLTRGRTPTFCLRYRTTSATLWRSSAYHQRMMRIRELPTTSPCPTFKRLSSFVGRCVRWPSRRDSLRAIYDQLYSRSVLSCLSL